MALNDLTSGFNIAEDVSLKPELAARGVKLTLTAFLMQCLAVQAG